jgi:hypothetical protein
LLGVVELVDVRTRPKVLWIYVMLHKKIRKIEKKVFGSNALYREGQVMFLNSMLNSVSLENHKPYVADSVADPDPGSGAFYPPDPGSGSGILLFRIPDPTYFCIKATNKIC